MSRLPLQRPMSLPDQPASYSQRGTLTLKILQGTDLVRQEPSKKTRTPSRFNPFQPVTGAEEVTHHAVNVAAILERTGGGSPKATPETTGPTTARTSTKLIQVTDRKASADWGEEFVFENVVGDMEVQVKCTDNCNGRDQVVGTATVPVSRLPQGESVEQWYQLIPPTSPDGSSAVSKAALRLCLCFVPAPNSEVGTGLQ
ncbi:unnamed protein product, partial [Chrysoparadoxa australica]